MNTKFVIAQDILVFSQETTNLIAYLGKDFHVRRKSEVFCWNNQKANDKNQTNCELVENKIGKLNRQISLDI